MKPLPVAAAVLIAGLALIGLTSRKNAGALPQIVPAVPAAVPWPVASAPGRSIHPGPDESTSVASAPLTGSSRSHPPAPLPLPAFHAPAEVRVRIAAAAIRLSERIMEGGTALVPPPRDLPQSPGISLDNGDSLPLTVPPHPRQPDIPAQIPAVLAPPSAESAAIPGLDGEMDRLAEAFSEGVSAPGLSPDSPEYADLWLAKQLSADQLLRLHYGDHAWHTQHLRARREAAAAAEE